MEQLVFISHSSIDKPVADAVCCYLEQAGMRCWIAPRDITTQIWASSIMDGLHHSEVFVVILSKHSIASQEVLKEVTEATHTCRYIMTVRIDNAPLNQEMQYHLGPYQWLNMTDLPGEHQLEELKEEILHLSDDDKHYTNKRRWQLQERMLLPRAQFTGREAEVDEIAERLKHNPVLFLQGMGGIGKSELAKGYAKKYRNRYDTIIFASYTSSLMELFVSEQIPVENLRNSVGGADGETQEDFFARKLQIIRAVSTSRTLLVIDNFDVEIDEHLEDIAQGPYHLLVTSRNDYENYSTLHVDKIRDFDQVMKIFAAHYKRPLREEDERVVAEMLRLVDCHTITVELIAKQMRASFVKPDKMLALLKESGTNTHLREKINREGGAIKQSAFDYICQLFQLSDLNNEEKQLLCCMCMIPHTGMEVSLFRQLCGLETFDAINSLLSRSWLALEDESDTLMLHPVIGDVVRDQLSPTPGSCKDFVVNIWTWCNNFWNLTYEERQLRAPYISFLLTCYSESMMELPLQYGDFINMAWMSGNFNLAIESGHRYYEAALKIFGPASDEAGNGAIYLASAYHNSGDDESAEPYYHLGLDHRLAFMDLEARLATGNEILVRQVATAYSKTARCAYMRHDFQKAQTDLKAALEIYRRLEQWHQDEAWKNNIRYVSGDAVVEMTRMYMEQQDYKAALSWAQRSYDCYFGWQNKEINSSAYALVDMGICHSHLGDYEKAENYFQRALVLNIVFNSEASMETMRTREAIADNNRRRGDTETAIQQYLELELSLAQDFGENNPQVLRLRKKRMSLIRETSL